MRVVLDSLSERPIQSYAAREAGIHRRTLENWIKRSKAGEDGYDIEHQDVTVRFHVHCEWSKEAAYDKILEAAYLIAMGKAYVTDENGNVTLETVQATEPKDDKIFFGAGTSGGVWEQTPEARCSAAERRHPCLRA